MDSPVNHQHRSTPPAPQENDAAALQEQTDEATVDIEQVRNERVGGCNCDDEEDARQPGEEEQQPEEPLGDYDLTCVGYVRRKLRNFLILLAWGLVFACCWAAGFWCTGQLRGRVPSHQLLLAATAPLLLAAGTGLLTRHFQHGNVAATIRYHWRPILSSAVLLSASLQLAFRAAQRLPVAADAACVWCSYAGIMSLPLCFVLQISCTQYGILAALLTVVNLSLLARPAFLRSPAFGVVGNATFWDFSWSSPPALPPTPPGDFVGCAVGAIFLAIAVTIVYWKLSGVSALPMLTLTCALLCVSSVCLQLLTVSRPLRLPLLRSEDAPLAAGAVVGLACGLPVLLHWLRSERSRLFQLVASAAISIVHLLGFLAAGQRPDAISLVAAALTQAATALVTLGQMRHESWLQYREDSKYKYSRLTILPDTPFQAAHAGGGPGGAGAVGATVAETSFNSVTAVRRQSDSANHNGDAFFQEVSLADEEEEERRGVSAGSNGHGSSGGGSDGGDSGSGGAWKPLKLG